MAITTLDLAQDGMQMPRPLIKTGIAMSAIAGMRGYSPWYAAGNPGASTVNAVGVNGAALTPASAAVEGRIPRTNPPGGQNAYLGRLSMGVSQPGFLWLIDRLWHNSGLSPTLTTAQAITPAALPSRDIALSANGDGIMAAVEWMTTGGVGTPTVSLTYTDEAGNAGSVGTLAGITTPPVGTFEIFTLAAGDKGIRAPTSFIQSVTRTSGTFSLVLFRLIAAMECPQSNIGSSIDLLTSGRPRILDDSVLQLVWFPSVTTAANFIGSYVETQG